ncbi:MAG: hypothetical protein AAF591_16575 [Verrucomicrobiota bacterium]
MKPRDFNHRKNPANTHFAPPKSGLNAASRQLLQHIVAGQATALEKDESDRLLAANLEARDYFFELLLTDTPSQN